MGKVTVVGSTNVDLAMRLAKWPQVGETIFGDSLQTAVGGKGANQAVAAARLGAEVTFVSAVGADSFGQMARAKFAMEQLGLHLFQAQAHTGIALIDIGPDGGNIIKLSPGANAELSADFVTQSDRVVTGCDVLLLQNEIGIATSLAAARMARAAGACVIMDPAPAPVPIWEDSVFAAFDVITPNAQEAAVILGQEVCSPAQGITAARALSRRFGTDVIVTLGASGAAWCFAGQEGHRPCPRVQAIDTVAAGDCFNGAFATRFAQSREVEQAVEFALGAAAMSTTRRGAIDSLPYLEELVDSGVALPT